jgi:hypothetical protein
MDRCATGACGAERVKCQDREKRLYATHDCAPRCAAYHECAQKCTDSDCEPRCAEALAPGLAACITACQSQTGSKADKRRCRAACHEHEPCDVTSCFGA